MTVFPIRTCSPALDLALRSGIELWKGDLFQFTLSDESTTYYWTSYETDLKIDGNVYVSQNPWIKRSKWNLTNTMEVPGTTVTLLSLNSGFAGGANIKLQAHNGLFDGASFLFSRVYMPTPGDVLTLGTIDIMGGRTGPANVVGNSVQLDCKGKNDILSQYMPRNILQVSCLHAFCDAGCTLDRATFTFPFTVGSTDLTAQFIPWGGSPPSSPSRFVSGTLTMTSGDASGQSRTPLAVDTDGVTLAYPLYETPAPGDTFTLFQGCDKTKDSGSGQSCTDYANLQNYRAFPFLPPPNSAY